MHSATVPRCTPHAWCWCANHVHIFCCSRSAYSPPQELRWSAGSRSYNFQQTIQWCDDKATGTIFRYQTNNADPLTCGQQLSPLIRVKPGKAYRLILKNVAFGPASTAQTNIHIHGSHISGDGNADNPLRFVEPGFQIAYNWTIPEDHHGGTIWYHPHFHPIVDPQLAGGGLGMLIVDDPQYVVRSMSADFKQFATSTANEILLLFHQQINQIACNGHSSADPETVDIISGQWYRVRIANGDPEATVRDITFGQVAGNNLCEVRAVAFDGVWRSTVPGPAQTTFRLTGASRIDLALKCTKPNGYSGQGRSSYVLDLNFKDGTANNASPWGGDSGTRWTPPRPTSGYLDDLTAATGVNPYTISMSAVQINGATWDPANINFLETFQYGDVQEWTLSGTTGHPVHTHIWHWQVRMLAVHHMHYGEWYDTVSYTPGCKVRFRMVGGGQTQLVHCHILGHEDKGAMVIFKESSGMS
ncbi:hypothetical protein JKP88DRAFT_203280 [Tribonema minus]|uniref:Laccase n=1 Tax=Tribonema minus TaxID=303371 RepID=A0A835YJ32_9STRA|nr:hypothetical protein JKP88DRAFT_203280 [Tribonema minus]